VPPLPDARLQPFLLDCWTESQCPSGCQSLILYLSRYRVALPVRGHFSDLRVYQDLTRFMA
jgi:hypothetical protein